jgi:hypothetical protein
MGELINLNPQGGIPDEIARDTEVASAIATHLATTDPHPGYLTQTEGDGRYRQTATPLTDADIPAAIARDAEVTTAINAHLAAADPHPGYLTQTEGATDFRPGTETTPTFGGCKLAASTASRMNSISEPSGEVLGSLGEGFGIMEISIQHLTRKTSTELPRNLSDIAGAQFFRNLASFQVRRGFGNIGRFFPNTTE